MSRFALAALLAVAAPTAAQDGSETAAARTVEGAQQFLVHFYAKGAARIETRGYLSGGEWSWSESPGSTSILVEAKVDAAKTLGRCKSEILFSSPSKKRFRASSPLDPVLAPNARLSLNVDWSKVTRVKADAGWVFEEGGTQEVPSGWHRAMIYWPGNSAFFLHLDPSDAERAAFAMQFLKEQCAPKSDTGF
jgi:hypothetical protein